MGPQRPEIEIIRTGREKRKSENVSECAYSGGPPPPRPIFCQSLHPSVPHRLLSVLCARVAAGSQADNGRRMSCCACGLSGEAEWSIFQITAHAGMLIISVVPPSLIGSFEPKHNDFMQIWILDELIQSRLQISLSIKNLNFIISSNDHMTIPNSCLLILV